MDDEGALVEISHEGGVAVLTMTRTDKHNALSMKMCRRLTEALSDAEGAKGVVIASAGSHFCVGADLNERANLAETGFEEARAAYAALIKSILASPVPVIAAASGYTLGGGLEIALAADLIVAAPSTVLGLPEVRIGIIPGGGGTQLLARRIGWGRAVDLTLTGRRVDAAEAMRIGLIDRLEDDAAGGGLRLAHEIAANSSSSVRLARTAMRQGWDRTLHEGLQIEERAWHIAAASDDYRRHLKEFGSTRKRRTPKS